MAGAGDLLRLLGAGLGVRDPGQPRDLGDAAHPSGAEGLVPLKAWVKMALDRVIGVCFGAPDLEFYWVGDDAVDPLQQAQTIAILVNAGVKTVAEARVELGLGGAAGVVKFNPNHDEQGRFTDVEHAVDPGAGNQVADNRDNSPTMTDVGGSGGSGEVAIGGTSEPMFEQPSEPSKPVEAPASAPDPALLDQLALSGVKVTPGDVVAIEKIPSGQIVWLEAGDQKSGLQHIVSDHGSEFSNIGVSERDIPGVLMRALSEGRIIGSQGKDRPIYETTINGQSYEIAITVGSNGFIVGANPARRTR